jgi:hypothetical protein
MFEALKIYISEDSKQSLLIHECQDNWTKSDQHPHYMEYIFNNCIEVN